MSPKKNQKKPLSKFITFSSIAFQMGVFMYLAAFFGEKLDAYYNNQKKIVTLIFIFIAFIGSFISIIYQLKNNSK